MARESEGTKHFGSFWATVARLGFTAILFFWLYLIWNSTVDLSAKLNAATDRYTKIDSLQVEYKDEIQEWKNLLLRSNSRETLNQRWLIYENQYQKVVALAQDIIANSDEQSITEKMHSFVDAHKANRDKYKDSVFILIKNKYAPAQADTAVKGIDQPLLSLLVATNAAMKHERDRTNESLIASARNQIETSLFGLAFIGLLAVWLPKN